MSIAPEASAKTLSQMVATRIRIAMAVEDIRQAELSRRIGKNEQWLSVRLRGRQPIDMNDLLLFARALGVGIHDLLPTAEEAAEAAPRKLLDMVLRAAHAD
jgi:transcriptional regulator with XRE-family HTH domain